MWKHIAKVVLTFDLEYLNPMILQPIFEHLEYPIVTKCDYFQERGCWQGDVHHHHGSGPGGWRTR